MAQSANRKYTDNFRKFRRLLQGKGVNVRETLVTVSAYADVRITVPGLHDDDSIISVLNMTDLVDVTGDLDDGSKTAARTTQNLTITALKAGTEGNAIGVQAWGGSAAVDGEDRISQPLSVKFAHETIKVYLATGSDGEPLTDGSNSATKVRVAILDAQEELHGDAWVDVTGSSGTDWTEFTVLLLTGGSNFKQGASTASLTTDLDDTSPYLENSDIRLVAQQPGVLGNDISLIYTAGGALAVAVSDEQITVTYVVGVTKASDVVAAINAKAAAAHLVKAGLPSTSGIGDGLIATMTETFLAGGADPGIQLSAATDVPLASKTLKVLWVTRDEKDEGGEV